MVSKCKRKIWSDIKNKYSDCQKSEGKKKKEKQRFVIGISGLLRFKITN